MKQAEFTGCALDGAHGVTALSGASVDPATLMSLAGPMALALGLRLT